MGVQGEERERFVCDIAKLDRQQTVQTSLSDVTAFCHSISVYIKYAKSQSVSKIAGKGSVHRLSAMAM